MTIIEEMGGCPTARWYNAVVALAAPVPGFSKMDIIDNIRKLNDIAAGRGQTLAQLAIAWVLRGGRVTSALIGASRSSQIVDCVAALGNTEFTTAELAEIDTYAREADINLWAKSAELES